MLASLTALLALAAQPVLEVPFRIAENAIVVDCTVNGRDVTLMFDTGFSGAVILDDRLNVGAPSGEMVLRDFVGEFTARTVKVESLSVGDKKMDAGALEIVQKPTDHYSYSYNTHVDGILGLEPFAPYVFEINFERKVFRFFPESYDIGTLQPDNSRTFLSRMLPKGVNSIELQVKAENGRSMVLALDTGNGFYATTHRDVLERIGLWTKGDEPNYMQTAMVASGPVDSWYLNLKNLSIYGVPVESSVWSIIDLPSSSADKDGTVGFGFLKHFNTTIDLKRRRVWLENFAGQVAEPPKGDIGIFAALNPNIDRYVIVDVTPGGPADEAGIQVGDHLLGIERVELLDIGWRGVMELMEGEPGSTVHLATSRNGQLMRYDLVRRPLVNGL